MSDYIKIPENSDEAARMALIGMAWLEANDKDKLTEVHNEYLGDVKSKAIQEEYSSLLQVVANQYDGNDTTDWSIGANHVFVLFAKEIQKRLDKLRNQKG